jgi:hypothetical protein
MGGFAHFAVLVRGSAHLVALLPEQVAFRQVFAVHKRAVLG